MNLLNLEEAIVLAAGQTSAQLTPACCPEGAALRCVTMCQLTLSVPDTTPEALRVPAAQLGAELLLAAAMKLYEARRLSSGAAAELAGLPKPVFLDRLAAYAVPAFRQSAAELQDETRLAEVS